MEIKFNCSNPACRQRISVDETLAGRLIQCPVCKKELEVPKSNSIRFNCVNPECGQHIVVDVSEAGRFVRCPSCYRPLLVPGSPPKPLVSSQHAAAKGEKLAENAISNNAGLAKSPKEVPRYVTGLFVTVIVLTIMTSWRLLVIKTRPAHVREIANELSSIGEFRSRPRPNNTGDKILFTQATENGIGMYLFDITSGKKQLIQEQPQKDYSVLKFRLLGWSPDDKQFAYLTGILKGQSQIIICDSSGKKTGNVFVFRGIEDFTWLSPNAVAYMSWPDRDLLVFKQKPDGAWGRTQTFKKIGDEDTAEFITLTATSYHSVVWQENDALMSFDFASNSPVQIWRSTTNVLERFYFSQETGKFLLTCGDKTGDSLFKFELPDRFFGGSCSNLGSVSSQSNSVLHALWINGEKEIAWFQRDLGQGTVFLKTNSSAEPLAVSSRGSAYSFAKSGNKLFVIDCPVGASPGIWEYNPISLSSNLVFSSQQHDFKYAKNIASLTGIITNTSGRKIAYHLWPSPQYSNNEKSMLLIGQTPYTWNAWEEVAANCGACVVSIDRPTFHSPELNNWGADVIDVYRELSRDPRINTNSLFLFARSAETIELTSMLEHGPNLWKGAIFFNPVTFPEAGLPTLRLSKIMIDSGMDDRNNLEMVPKFLQRASEAGIPTTLVLHKDAGHTYHASSTEREQAEEVVKFLFGS